MGNRNKFFKITIIVLSTLVFFGFASPSYSYQVECLKIEEDGYITLKIWDTKKASKYKPEQARKDAIHAILYSGVSGGSACSTQPSMLSKTEEQENFKNIEKSFFSKNGKWAMYTRSSTPESTLPTSLGTKNWKVYQVSVSKNELRKYLEDQKIIKSLNSGF